MIRRMMMLWVLVSLSGCLTMGCIKGGLGHLIAGLAIDEAIDLNDPNQDGENGADGLNCWDLNADGVFDEDEEDTDGDGEATAYDCRGVAGPSGADGNDGLDGSDGATGSAGLQGVLGATGPVGPRGPAGADGEDSDDDNGPPFGNGPDADKEVEHDHGND